MSPYTKQYFLTCLHIIYVFDKDYRLFYCSFFPLGFITRLLDAAC